MRLAEARISLGVVAARQGAIEEAVHHGKQALNGRRKSLPSLLVVRRDLTHVLRDRYPSERAAQTYLRGLQAISQTHEPPRHLPSETSTEGTPLYGSA
jgi:hypothetical protein